MDKSFLDLLRRNGFARSVLAVTATLVLGALGSGLWELLLKDLFIGLGNITLSLISLLWGGYVDLLHQNIGKLENDLLVVPIYALVVAAVVVTPWVLIRYLMRELSKLEARLQKREEDESRNDPPISERIGRLRKKVLRVLVPLAALATMMFLILTWQLLYTRAAGGWAARSIEIIAPYVTLDERTRLISELRRVESAKQFFALRQALNEHAGRAGIKLPKFTPIGEK